MSYSLPIAQPADAFLLSYFRAIDSACTWHAGCHATGVAYKVEELDTWKLCSELVDRLQQATESGVASRDRRFCEQINDAAADALSDLAEGFARFNPKEHASFLGYAISSLEEVRTRAAVGYKRKYFDEKTTSSVMNLCYRAERAIKNHRAYLWSVKKENLPARPTVPANPQRRKRREP